MSKPKPVTPYARDFVAAKFDQPRLRANVELSRREDLDP